MITKNNGQGVSLWERRKERRGKDRVGWNIENGDFAWGSEQASRQ